MNFNELPIDVNLKSTLKNSNFIKPTQIQIQSIPAALNGKDILGTAQTGTGKTLAFTIPLINKLILNKDTAGLSKTQSKACIIQTCILALPLSRGV